MGPAVEEVSHSAKYVHAVPEPIEDLELDIVLVIGTYFFRYPHAGIKAQTLVIVTKTYWRRRSRLRQRGPVPI